MFIWTLYSRAEAATTRHIMSRPYHRRRWRYGSNSRPNVKHRSHVAGTGRTLVSWC